MSNNTHEQIKYNKLKELSNEEFDVLVVGGGITGVGIALDAASRGLKTILFEKLDFASGTSSRSTKLIHGGLRYLKQFDFKLVRDTGTERAIAYNNAPHIVIPEKMLMPIVENGSYGKFMAWVGLSIYDRLAKVKKSERRKMVNKDGALAIEPKLRQDILKGGGYYTEYRTDDARLTTEVMKTAVQKGAYCFNYTEVLKFSYSDSKMNGAKVKVDGVDEPVEIKAKQIINATGPWTDGLRKSDKSLNNKKLHLTKGVHLVIPNERFSITDTIYFDVPGGRMIFVIPRGKITYIGTTDTNYKGELEEPDITKFDVDYLLQSVNNMFPSAKLETKDIISSWSGLRPLIHEEGKDPSEISRKDEVFISDSGLITIAGGKLTGYRLMAKKIVDIACKKLAINQKCKTKNLTLSGGTIKPENKSLFIQGLITSLTTLMPEDNKAKTIANELYNRYGSNASVIIENALENNQTILTAEINYCIAEEKVTRLTDYFIRRSGKMYFDPKVVSIQLDEVTAVFANHFGWDNEQISAEKQTINNWLNKIIDFK